ncbi:MAG: MlaD family protein [Planctomycetota bacterium]|nr:MlaD family protein [Planctomycetota bacterium]
MNGSSSWKLGLFVLSGLLLLVGSAFYLGARRLIRPSAEVVSFFDESVQGLETGAPLKMRGVTIGKVKDISFAPDGRVVRVTSDVFLDVLRGLGLQSLADDADLFRMLPPDLRVRLAVTGITGVRFLEVDSVDPTDGQDLVLGFELPQNHLPARRSTLKGLEQSLLSLANQVPELIERIDGVAQVIQSEVESMQLAATFSKARSTLDTLQAQAASVDMTGLQGAADATFSRVASAADEVRIAAAALRSLVETTAGGEGPAGSALLEVADLAEATRQAVEQSDLPGLSRALTTLAARLEDLGPEARGALGESRQTLRGLRDTLSALTLLLRQLELDPASLIRGRGGR